MNLKQLKKTKKGYEEYRNDFLKMPPPLAPPMDLLKPEPLVTNIRHCPDLRDEVAKGSWFIISRLCEHYVKDQYVGAVNSGLANVSFQSDICSTMTKDKIDTITRKIIDVNLNNHLNQLASEFTSLVKHELGAILSKEIKSVYQDNTKMDDMNRTENRKRPFRAPCGCTNYSNKRSNNAQ